MARRQLLTNEERQALLGIPLDPDGMARRFTLSRADQDLVAGRRRDTNRIGFAVQLALLRYPGIALAQLEQPVEPLVQWLAKQLEIPAAPFDEYAHRPQTMTDHARLLATSLGLRPSSNADLPMMIEAAAQAAWGTDRGHPIAAAVVSALRAASRHPPGRRRHRAHRDCRPRPSPHACGRALFWPGSLTRRWPSSMGCSSSILP